MTKQQGVKGKYQRTLNEKYEMYLNSVTRIINTNNSVVAIIILMLSEPDFVSHWFIGAHLHVVTSDRTPGGFSPIKFQSNKRLISTWVLCNKKWLWWKQVNKTKPSKSITEHRQGKLLNKTPTDKDTFIHNLFNHPKECNLAASTGVDKHNGNSCERYTFLY
jgi:hypothetical protein